MNECSIDGCEKPIRARGWCATHWSRWNRTGETSNEGRKTMFMDDPEGAFTTRTQWRGDCLIWTGSMSTQGYGRMRANGRMQQVHRWAWEQSEGPIPTGIFVDHVCWNRACANVDHLRLATPSQNQQNLSGARRNSTTGVRGVYRKDGGYSARVRHLGKLHYFGTFPTIEEAAAVASAKRKELFGEFAGAA